MVARLALQASRLSVLQLEGQAWPGYVRSQVYKFIVGLCICRPLIVLCPLLVNSLPVFIVCIICFELMPAHMYQAVMLYRAVFEAGGSMGISTVYKE